MAAFFIGERALHDLGWPRLLAALAARTQTALGHERALASPFLDDREAIEQALARIEEARALLRENQPMPLGGVEDTRGALARAAKSAVLSPQELLACTRLMRAAAAVKRFLAARKDVVPLLGQLGQGLTFADSVAQAIEGAIEPSGHIRDSASSTLASLRAQALGLHRGIKARIEQLLHDADFATNLQDSYFSVRNDRYVLPINASFRSKVPGIVHNASQSGATVFVEPQEIVPMGNELAIAESLAQEEEQRILAMFSDEVGDLSADLAASLGIIAHLDVVQASATLANALDCTVPTLLGGGEGVHLKRMRHPLLALQGKTVVANDVRLDGDAFALVVSGPNAGGKTVTLTGAGLCSLMIRAGLPIPVSSGSRQPLFKGVLCAVGDAQDMTRGLSSFSAHVAALTSILEVARHGWLVLIDEIGADTDPREGAAIARATLEDLVEKRVRVLVTTHLEEIKALGVTDGRFHNARVGFDAQTLKPTFCLELGAAGVSNALAMAAQVGYPEALLERARKHLSTTGQLSAALGRLEQSQNEADALRADLAAQRAALEAERAQLVQAKAEAEATRKEVRQRVRDEMASEVDAARQEVSAMIARLQAQPTIRHAQEAQRALGERSQALQRPEPAPRPKAAPVAIRPGMWVRAVSLGSEGEVMQVDADSALVQMGQLRTRVKFTDLEAATRKQTGKKTKTHFPGGARKPAAQVMAAPVQTASIRCDLRGMRADDATRELEKALDATFSDGGSALLIVHGHGTGALKEVVREVLRHSPHVARFRAGDRHEGGDGVTVAEFD